MLPETAFPPSSEEMPVLLGQTYTVWEALQSPEGSASSAGLRLTGCRQGLSRKGPKRQGSFLERFG